MPSAYRSYHSDLKLQYASNKLQSDVTNSIPRSTKQRWKGKNIQSFWTPYPPNENRSDETELLRLKKENARLKVLVKSLFYLVSIYKELTALSPVKSTQVLIVRRSIEMLLRSSSENGLGKAIWRYLPFSFKQWKAWSGQKHCLNSSRGRCRRQNPQQLSISEQEIIRSECVNKEYDNWPLSSIYYQLLRDRKIHCCLSTFYKYCRLLNITKKCIRKPKKYTPFRTNEALKVLHQDITLFKTMNGVKHYIYVIRDNFSRAILACKVATEYNSELARQTLEGVLQKFGLMDQEGTLVTDDGMENKGKLEDWLNKPGLLWKKLIAQLDIIQSNSMVEAANKILKYRFLYTKPIADTHELTFILEHAAKSYNQIPNCQLYGFTPNEVLAGAIPNKHYFRMQIELGKNQRLIVNRNFPCKMVCQI
ncbi:DDE-type integrase/transposase/recombinase [Chitinophaga ginsengisegetis]|uniref:DDE-type integrase/transposase/recombinase n=1 Tax=Chitinophaga ginsengisegetis TaxID=393003 RepID=UPI000DB9DAF2|nr:DDE-type integrase/transposase/recombinase [Chitinophaga ginsengisegetis]MDR6570884.1 transposase InsO family protein [Chitinophaga ginsengisegetis]MDR6650618.1 transposase InsO family protein [Chitinophaga ginsengisegetis]MDR6656968.1 transposase InsO family protein [Chitinophaga ginsengisegetis]